MSFKRIAVNYQGWGQNWLLGELIEKDKKIYFQYSKDFLAKKFEMSPFKVKAVPTVYQDFPAYLDKLPGFICDSLPDGWGRLLMDRFFASKGLSLFEISVLDRLAFLGDRAMGALAFSPCVGQELPEKELTLLDYAKESQLITEEKDSQSLIELLYQGGSPHGARPKAVLNYNPITKEKGEDWLVKFRAATEHKEVCAIEAWYMQTAKTFGLETADFGYINLDLDNAAFAIKRFDRTSSGQKVPMQTLASMLHIDYRVPGVIDYLAYLKLVRFVCRDEQEVEKAFKHCLFNVVMNNRDDHGKNFSFKLTKEFKWKCAPVYDLTYCEGPGGEHHMAVMGKGKHITRSDVLSLAKNAGIDAKKAEKLLNEILDIAQIAQQEGEAYSIRGKTLTVLNKAISENIRLLG